MHVLYQILGSLVSTTEMHLYGITHSDKFFNRCWIKRLLAGAEEQRCDSVQFAALQRKSRSRYVTYASLPKHLINAATDLTAKVPDLFSSGIQLNFCQS